MTTKTHRVGVLCVNLGTPKSADKQDVRRYLREFLADPRLIPNRFVRGLVARLVPWLRAPGSAQKYQRVWFDSPEIYPDLAHHLKLYEWAPDNKRLGSGLLYHSLNLTTQLASALQAARQSCTFEVMLGMNIGEPSSVSSLERLTAWGASVIVIIPLFPQYASCTFGGTLDRLYKKASRSWFVPAVRTIAPFSTNPDYIAVLADHLSSYLPEKSFHVVISFHGLPVKSCLPEAPSSAEPYPCDDKLGRCCESESHQLDRCYRRQCARSAKLLAEHCSLKPESYTLAFQSKVGPSEWTSPGTLEVLTKLAEGAGDSDLKEIVIICPSFITDCLETLEEIHLEAVEHIAAINPGLKVRAVPCLNHHQGLVQFFKDQILGVTGDLT